MKPRRCMNLWIAGAVLSAATLAVQDLSAYDRSPSDQESQGLTLRLVSPNEAEAVSEFERRLQDYDAVRRALDSNLPAAAVTDDAATIRRVLEAHNQALRSARYTARQGDIFSADVTEIVRGLIRESRHGVNPQQFIASMTEADATPMHRPFVNASYPDGGALTTMPPELLRRLPALPAGLEYRFMDRDLILWDLHANLIVDFIPDAVGVGDKR